MTSSVKTSLASMKTFEFEAPIQDDVGFERIEAILWPLLRHLDLSLEESSIAPGARPEPLGAPCARSHRMASSIWFAGGRLGCRVTGEPRALTPVFWQAVYAVREVAAAHFDAGEISEGAAGAKITILQPIHEQFTDQLECELSDAPRAEDDDESGIEHDAPRPSWRS